MRIDRPGRFCIETLFPIQNGLALRMIFQEIPGDEGIGSVGALIINAALPGIQPFIGNGFSGAGACARPALIADIFRQRLIANTEALKKK